MWTCILQLVRELMRTHIKGLQRIGGTWRIYLDNINDKVTLMAEGVPLRGKIIPVLGTNPNRLDNENVIRIRIKNIPLSVDDGVITRRFTLDKIDTISCVREKLRVRGKLTNCATGDRLLAVKASSLTAPLPNFMQFDQFKGRVIHYGQKKPTADRPKECTQCFKSGHVFSVCTNDWVCTRCKLSGHKQSECMLTDNSDTEQADSESSDNDNNDKDLNRTMKSVKTSSPPYLSPVKSVDPEKSTKSDITVQQYMDKFLVNKSETPNKGRRLNAPERSPPTPTETLHDKQSPVKKNNK